MAGCSRAWAARPSARRTPTTCARWPPGRATSPPTGCCAASAATATATEGLRRLGARASTFPASTSSGRRWRRRVVSRRVTTARDLGRMLLVAPLARRRRARRPSPPPASPSTRRGSAIGWLAASRAARRQRRPDRGRAWRPARSSPRRTAGSARPASPRPSSTARRVPRSSAGHDLRRRRRLAGAAQRAGRPGRGAPTMSGMRLGVLDQSPVAEGSSGAAALRETVALARLTEEPRLRALLGGRAPRRTAPGGREPRGR